MNQPRRARSRTRERGVVSSLVRGLSAGLLALIVGVGVLVIAIPAATGSVPLTVLTRSMEPAYPPGTLVIVRPVDTAEISLGDAITYQLEPGNPALVTHRVMGITSTSAGELRFTTQGDNNAIPDAHPVIPDQIKGEVWYSVPWIGYLNTLVGGMERSLLVLGVVAVLLAYAGWMFLGAILERSARRRQRAAARRDELAAAVHIPHARTRSELHHGSHGPRTSQAGDVAHPRLRHGFEVGRREFDLETAPPARDEDRVP